MNKTELMGQVKNIVRFLKGLEIGIDISKDKEVVKQIEGYLRSLIPNSRVRTLIENYKDEYINDVMLTVLIDADYIGRNIENDLRVHRCRLKELLKVHRGIEIELILNREEKSVIASVCVDYVLENGYNEINDIVPIISRTL